MILLSILLMQEVCRPPLTSFDVHRVELENGYLHSTGGVARETRVIEVDYMDNRRILTDLFDSQGFVVLTNAADHSRRIKYRHHVPVPIGNYTVTQHSVDYEVCADDGKVTFYTDKGLASGSTYTQDWIYSVEIDLYGDLNNDGAIDGYDLGMFFASWGMDGETDFNSDGITDGQDMGILFENWTG